MTRSPAPNQAGVPAAASLRECGVASPRSTVAEAERRDRRGYQFQDGRLRVFKEGYYDMLEPVSPKPDGTPRIVSSLKTMLAKSMDMRARAEATRTPASRS